MPIESVVRSDERRVYTTCHGVVTLSDFTSYQDSVWSNPDLYGYDELFDASHADIREISFGDLLTVAERTIKLHTLDPNAKLAVVLSPGRQEKLGRFYSSAKKMLPVKSRELRFFLDIKEAIEWLNT